MIKTFLFETRLGNALLVLFERITGLTLVDLEWLDRAIMYRLKEEGINYADQGTH